MARADVPQSSVASRSGWPALPYDRFAPTAHLLHMGLQAIGKLTLRRPFEPEWANVALTPYARGLTTGLIPDRDGAFSIDVDLVAHEVHCTTTSGRTGSFPLGPMAVAAFVDRLRALLVTAGIDPGMNPVPQEVPDPIPFDDDRVARPYDRDLVQAWWRVLLSVTLVLQRFHARFRGKTQPIGFMWGTFDLRDVRYEGRAVTPPAETDFIRRNAMDAALFEAGFWSGSAAYPRPAFYAFTFPAPAGIESAPVRPGAARWDPAMGEFLLDYDSLRASPDPAGDLLDFLESTYRAGADLAGWDPALVGPPVPVGRGSPAP